MNTDKIKDFISRNQTMEQLKTFINENISEVMKRAISPISTVEQMEGFYICIIFLNSISVHSEVLKIIQQHEDFPKVLRRLLDVLMSKQSVKKVPQLCMALLINSSKLHETSNTILQLMNQKEFLELYRQLVNENGGVYLLMNLSVGMKNILVEEMIDLALQKVQKRDKETLPYAQLLKNYFIYLQDDGTKADMYQNAVKGVCLELTGQEFYQQFVDSLKPTELDQKDVFVKDKPVHQKVVQAELIDILLIYIRFNKQLIKNFYCQLRECHSYNISLYDVCELNDKLNDLIEYAISLEEGEEDQLMPQIDNHQQEIQINAASSLTAQENDNIDAVELK